MNSRKKLATLGFTFFSLIILTTAKAQPQINYNNNNIFNVTTPVLPNPQIERIPAYSKVFFETGTGDFFIFSTKDFNPSFQQHTFPQPWNLNSNATTNIQSVAQISTFYDTTIKPHSGSYFVYNSSPGMNTPNPPLLTNSNIIITNAINRSIIPGDTMTLALTYKNTSWSSGINGSCSTYNKSVIAFFYNGIENPVLFNQIPVGPNAVPYNFYGINVPAVRKHAEDVVLLSGTDLFYQLANPAGQNDNIFNGGLYISVPYVPNGPERNIFLSMVVKTALTKNQINSGGLVKAVLIDYDSLNINTCHNIRTYQDTFAIKLLSRDPNHITTTPFCLGGDQDKARNKIIDYKIHFENIGIGIANEISIAVTIPPGIKFPPNDNTRFTCKIGNNDIFVAKEGTVFAVKGTTAPWCLYQIKPSTNEIIFKITRANLLGIGKHGVQNDGTGDINFKLSTNSSGIIPQCMYSVVSIVFEGNRAVQDACLIMVNCKDIKPCPSPLDPKVDPKHVGD